MRQRLYLVATIAIVLLAMTRGAMATWGRWADPVPTDSTGQESHWVPATPQAAALRVGLYVRSLGPIDISNETFAATFDVWFVGYELPQASDFAFLDAVGPLKLGEPVVLRKTNNLDYARYHVEGTFKYLARPADLVSDRVRITIRMVDIAKPLTAALLLPDGEDSKLLPDEDHATTDGAFLVKAADLDARSAFRPTLGDPSEAAVQVAHGEIVASFVLRPISFSLYQRLQGLIPGPLALPVLIAMAVLLATVPMLGRLGVPPSPWRRFAVLAALALLLVSGQKLFALRLAPELTASAIKATVVVTTAAWLVLVASFVITLLPHIVWHPLERRSGGPASALERAAVNFAVVLSLLLFFLAHTLDLSPGSIGAASGILTIVMGIALQNIILDLFSGMLLNLEKPFRLRHWISVTAGGGPITGQVRNMNWRTTQLQTRDNCIASIPNSFLAKATIKNFALPSLPSRFTTDFVLRAGSGVNRARQALRVGAMRAVEAGAVLDQPPPGIAVVGVEEHGIRFRLGYYLDVNLQEEVASSGAVVENVMAALAESGIKLASRDADAIESFAGSGHPDALLDEHLTDAKVVKLPLDGTRRGQAILEAAEIALIRSSWETIRPLGEAVAVLFYNRLFEIAPPLRSLFKDDGKAQRQKLMLMLTMMVRSLDRPEALIEMLADLGLRHGTFGVRAADYEPVGAALLWTLEKGLGDGFDDATHSAWTRLYIAAAGAMTKASGVATA